MKIIDLIKVRKEVDKAINPALSIHMDKDGRTGNEYRVNEIMKILKKYLKQSEVKKPCPGYCDVCRRHCQLEEK